MTLTRRRMLQIGAACAALPLTRLPAGAQTYPLGPIRVVVGFPENGPVDIAARVIAPWLTEKLEQKFEVENQPGESGNIATRGVLRAAADGRTLLLCGPVNTINTTLFPNLDFNFTRDSAPVAGLYRVPLVIEVNPSLPISSAAEFLAHAKANPGKLKVAYAGNGTPQHVGIELFKAMAGVDLTLVPYPGSAPALADLLSGKVDAMFDPLPSSLAHVKNGRLRALAVTTPTRSEALPGVPAIGDVVPGYEAGSWFGLVAPRGTPAPLVEALNRAVNGALADTAIKARIAGLGGIAISMSPGAFGDFISTETKRYARVIRAARIEAK